MQSIICKQCNAALNWDGQSEILRCPYCGTQYRMRIRHNSSGVRTGLGTVSEIQTTQGRYTGHALVRSFIPKGWTVQTNAPEQQANILMPLSIQVVYASPAQDAFITFTGTQAFHHLEPTPQNMPMQGQMIMPDHMIGMTYRDANAVCDGIILGNPALSDIQLLAAEDSPDAWAQNVQNKELQGYAQGGLMNPGGSWVKKLVSVHDAAGDVWHKQVEAMVNYGYMPISPGEQMAYQMMMNNRARSMSFSSMLGDMRGLAGGLMAGLAQPQAPQPKLRWAIQYVVETSARKEIFPAVQEYHEKIRNTIETLPLFRQEMARIRDSLLMQIQQDSAAVNSALSQMNQAQMDSWNRKQNIVQSASDYGSNVMHQIFQSNAETSQRVNNGRSESIRGVNTFFTDTSGFGVPPVVEAGTQWDHVYQNTQHPDQFAGAEGDAGFDFGVDYTELKKTGGNY